MAYNGRSTRDGGAILRPDLAADYPSISSDGLTWTFKIKQGLHYAPPMADKSIVAGDFVRSMERALRPDPFADPQQHDLHSVRLLPGRRYRRGARIRCRHGQLNLRARDARRPNSRDPPDEARRRSWCAPRHARIRTRFRRGRPTVTTLATAGTSWPVGRT